MALTLLTTLEIAEVLQLLDEASGHFDSCWCHSDEDRAKCDACKWRKRRDELTALPQRKER